jgi:hypothetical protein
MLIQRLGIVMRVMGRGPDRIGPEERQQAVRASWGEWLWPLVLEAFHLPKQLRQPRDVDGDPARLVLCHFRACSLTSKGPAKKF